MLEHDEESDVDQVHAPKTWKPRVLLMLFGAATVVLCCMARTSALQAARIPAVVGFAKKHEPPFSDPGIKLENPEEYYDFGEEIYSDQVSITKVVTKKDSGDKYLAEIIIFEDKDMSKIAERVYHLKTETLAGVKGVPEVIESYMVQHNLIMISPYVETKPVLEWLAARAPITEGDVAKLLVSIIEVVTEIHAKSVVHGSINPSSVRVAEDGSIWTSSFMAARKIDRKSGVVLNLISETEYAAPEVLAFDVVLPSTDIWSVGVLADTLFTGKSPFYHEDEQKVVDDIQKVKRLCRSCHDSMMGVGATSEAMEAVEKAVIRVPENRAHDAKYLELWQACESETHELDIKARLLETNTRLQGELREDAVSACGPFTTFDEEKVWCEDDDDEDY